MEALVCGMMAGLDRRRILQNTQTAKEENRKRGRCATARITCHRTSTLTSKTVDEAGSNLRHADQDSFRYPGHHASERSLDC